MKQLFEIDLRDYEGCTNIFSRPSARGIIVQDGKMALVYSRREKYYKFPGGGIRPEEDKKAALIREVKEEVGLTVIPESITEFGSVMRRQKSNYSPNTIFEQENFYYVCRTDGRISDQHLDDYEREAEFVLQWTDIDEAIRVNDAYFSEDSFDEIMIKRELRVLQIIREAMITQKLLPYGYVMRAFPDEERIYGGEYAEMRNVVCFHNPDELNGYLSNWYMSDFVIDGIRFTSMEQYMMYSKAVSFNDGEIAAKILSTTDVGKIKALGRLVKNYNETYWNGVRQIIVYNGLLEKFRQNRDLADKLLSTGEDILAECAVSDKIWGIGLSMHSKDRFDVQKWQGKNLLGYALMMVRNALKTDNDKRGK